VVKYNFSVDSPQSQNCFDGFIQLDEAGEKIEVLTKKILMKPMQYVNEDYNHEKRI
jgi:hypothetical protein